MIVTGDAEAEPAAPHVASATYADLRRAAAALLAHERIDHTLDPTALVHEAWLRVARAQAGAAPDGPHFAALVAHVMRHVLVDHARARATAKRGGGAERRSVDAALDLLARPNDRAVHDVLAIDDALRRLEHLDPNLVRVVELRFFAGRELSDVAAALGCSVRTVTRRWQLARAFLARELADHDPDRP